MALDSLQKRYVDLVKTDRWRIAKLKLGTDLGKLFQHMKSHPLFCGLHLYALQVLYEASGVSLSAAWGSILYSARLYNAVRQEKLLEAQWKDMELLLRLQSDVYLGERSTNPEEYLPSPQSEALDF